MRGSKHEERHWRHNRRRKQGIGGKEAGSGLLCIHDLITFVLLKSSKGTSIDLGINLTKVGKCTRGKSSSGLHYYHRDGSGAVIKFNAHKKDDRASPVYTNLHFVCFKATMEGNLQS